MLGERSDRDRVLDATDITGVVGDVVELKPKGREFVCLCPFHDDHSPSMYVVPSKQIFHCFSCGAGGNVFDFVMRYHGMEFVEALKFLADRSGVTLTPWQRNTTGSTQTEAKPAGPGKQALAEAMSFALGFFKLMLRHETHGKPARALFAGRGISQELIERFELGAAPDRWDGLASTVQSKGLDVSVFVAAGLLKRREDGSCYDTFRNRAMFTIADITGRPIAFGARRIDEEDEPKYLNSPESPLFDKGSTLFAMHLARPGIGRTQHAVVVEGYTDAIACHAAGFDNVVATLGTALTPKHARGLRRLCNRVTFLFDGDEAGMRAADRACAVCFAEPFDVRVLILPGGMDPDDYLKAEGGPERFAGILDGAQDAMAYRFGRLRAQLEPLGPAARAAAIEAHVAELVELGLAQLSPVRRRSIIDELARATGTDASVIGAAIREASQRAGARRRSENAAPEPGVLAEPRSTLEHALACLLAEPALVSSEAERGAAVLSASERAGGPLARLAEALRGASSTGTPTAASVLQSLDHNADADARTLAIAFAGFALREHSESLAEVFADAADRIADQAPDTQADHLSRLERARAVNRSLGERTRPSIPIPLADP